jgi:hypothetical protein
MVLAALEALWAVAVARRAQIVEAMEDLEQAAEVATSVALIRMA